MKKLIKSAVIVLLVLALLSVSALPLFALTPSFATSVYKTGKYYKNLTAVTLTGDMRKDIVAVAKSQVGYHEGNSEAGLTGTTSGGSNYTEYGYYFAERYNNSYLKHAAWCGMFVSWCAAMAGIPESVVPACTSAQPSGSYSYKMFGSDALPGANFKTFYDLRVRGGSYTPLPGDLVFYASSAYKGSRTGVSYKHVGIVESVTYNYNSDGSISSMVITTFEGNTTDSVSNKKWTIASGADGRVYSGCYIAGFGIPNYTTGVVTPVIDPPVTNDPVLTGRDLGAYAGTVLKLGSSGAEVAKLQMALNVLGAKYKTVSSVSVTGVFDAATDAASKQYQAALSLDVDGEIGPASWRSLRSEFSAYTAAYESDYIMSGSTLLFYNGTAATVTLPDSVKEVGGAAFACSASLKEIRFPAGLTGVAPYAFAACTALKSAAYMCAHKDVETIVDPTGNGPLTSAASTYGVAKITFIDAYGNTAKISCPLGETPIPPYIPEKSKHDGSIVYFLGWDKEIVPASEDAVYTALTVEFPIEAAVVETDDFLCGSGDFISIDLKILLPEALDILSDFSIDVDYREYLEYMDFTGFVSEINSVNIAENTHGVLTVTGSDIVSEEGDPITVATLKFALDDLMPDMDVQFVSDGGNSMLGKVVDGSFYKMNVNYDIGTIRVNSTSRFDTDKNGILNIEDVTALLDKLAKESNAPSVPHAPGDVFTIEDVSSLLDLLAK